MPNNVIKTYISVKVISKMEVQNTRCRSQNSLQTTLHICIVFLYAIEAIQLIQLLKSIQHCIKSIVHRVNIDYTRLDFSQMISSLVDTLRVSCKHILCHVFQRPFRLHIFDLSVSSCFSVQSFCFSFSWMVMLMLNLCYSKIQVNIYCKQQKEISIIL